MAKRKFSRYTVDFKKIYTKNRTDGLIETKSIITGGIEIGIDIDPMTWRRDWLADQVFGKDNASNYRLLNVQNNYPEKWDKNEVIAVWSKWK